MDTSAAEHAIPAPENTRDFLGKVALTGAAVTLAAAHAPPADGVVATLACLTVATAGAWAVAYNAAGLGARPAAPARLAPAHETPPAHASVEAHDGVARETHPLAFDIAASAAESPQFETPEPLAVAAPQAPKTAAKKAAPKKRMRKPAAETAPRARRRPRPDSAGLTDPPPAP